MPSPVAHSLVAYGVHCRLREPQHKGARLFVLLALVLVSSLPDVDFLVGWVAGDVNLYHHQVTHSIGFCLPTAGILAVTTNRAWRIGVGRWAVVHGVLLGMHLLLDALTADTRAPYGQPLFWPLWGGYVQFPFTLFLDVRRAGARTEFFQSLLSAHNLKAVAWEILLLGPLMALAGRWRKSLKAEK